MSWRDSNGAIGSLGAHVRDRSAPPRGSRGNETPTISQAACSSRGRRRWVHAATGSIFASFLPSARVAICRS